MEAEYKDKKAGLIVFGIIEILGGLLCALFAVVAFLPLILLKDEFPGPQIWMGVLVYVVLAVWLIGVGIATIRARRWARVLKLAVSWLMLVCGALGMCMMLYMMPKFFESSTLPDGSETPVLIFVYSLLSLIYLVFPGIGVLFHGNRNVRATFEHRDPLPSWTEQCPLPVLILVMMFFLASISILSLCFMNFALPFFGTIVSGWQGAIVLLLSFGVVVSLMIGVYKTRPAAWWGAMVLLLLGMASQLITYSRIDLMDYYVDMGYSDEMLLTMNNADWMTGSMYSWMAVIYAAPALIYLLYLKRYFKTDVNLVNEGEGNV